MPDLQQLRELPGTGGRAALLGFCYGGGLAYAAASGVEPPEAPDALVSYYGSALPTLLERATSPAATDDDRARQLQWLFYQTSGQGPYFGQYAWFANWHPEKIPSAIERYEKEIERVLGVLDGVLSKQQWLVANKPTVADFAFYQYVPDCPFAGR